VLVGRIRKGTLRHDLELTGGAELQQQRNKGEQQDIGKEDRECWLSREHGSFHLVG